MLKKILLLVLVTFTIAAKAQRRTPWNLREWDKRKYHFGFTLGFNSSSLNLNLKDNVIGSDSLLGVTPDGQPGFNLGIVTSLTFHPQLRLRFIPSLSFEDRMIIYRYNSIKPYNQQIVKRIESTFVNLPLLLKYRSKRINNMATYLIAGVQYGIDMASQQDIDNNKSDEIIVKMKKHNYSFQVGGGFDFFLLYFKFGLELKADFGIPNAFIQDNSQFSKPLDQFRTRAILFSLTFEG